MYDAVNVQLVQKWISVLCFKSVAISNKGKETARNIPLRPKP